MQQLTNPRELRGLAILSQPNTIIQLGKNDWDVRSQSKEAYYHVTRTFVKGRDPQHLHDWSCTCLDFETHHLPCKHIYSVQFSLKLGNEVEKQSVTQHITIEEPKILCPACRSAKIVKRGIRKTNCGEIQRYGCNDCDHRFVIDMGFSKMKFGPKVITLTLDLYFKGLSQRKIADHLKQFESVSVTQPTILSWIKKYLKLLATLLGTQRNTRWKLAISGIVTKRRCSSRKKERRSITSGSGT